MLALMTRFLLNLSFASLILSAGAHAAAEEKAELKTVPYVDIQQYLGKWYEIARLPLAFQPACTAVTAEYSLNDDGSIKVFNFCRLLDPVAGAPVSIVGEANPIDASNSKLKVNFFNGRPLGKYWVLELDPNYQWALVGDPSRSSLFVLSRRPYLNLEILKSLLQLAVEKHAYDIAKLIITEHAPSSVNQ